MLATKDSPARSGGIHAAWISVGDLIDIFARVEMSTEEIPMVSKLDGSGFTRKGA